MKDDNDEMPADFDNEIHKWSLECEYIHIRPSELSADNCIATDLQYDRHLSTLSKPTSVWKTRMFRQWSGYSLVLSANTSVSVECTACMSMVEVPSGLQI